MGRNRLAELVTPEKTLTYFIQRAREDVHFFANFVFGYMNADIHREWHALAEKHDRLILHAPIDHGKTEQMAIVRVLWLIGRNPNIRIAICSSTLDPQALKIVSQIKRVIEESEFYHMVFPHIKPGKPWLSDRITVQRKSLSKDATVQACGIGGSILGSRLDLVIVDDGVSSDNTWSARQREKTLEYIQSDLLSRIVDGGRFIAIGTAWHRDDALFVLGRRQRFKHVLYKAVMPGKKLLWPKRNPDDKFGWSLKRVAQKRSELGEASFQRQIMNEPRSDATAWCKEAWIEKCVDRDLMPGMRADPQRYWVVTGVDPAVGKRSSKDRTCLFTIAVHRETRQRVVLDVRSGNWTGPEILAQIEEVHRSFGSTVYLEDNSAQDYLRQFLIGGDPAFPIHAHHTSINKADENTGIVSVFTELERGAWRFFDPEQWEELGAWVSECLEYHPRDHTGDRLMASWIAREGARALEKESVPIAVSPMWVDRDGVWHGGSNR